MKKLLMIGFVCLAMLGAKTASAQFNFYHHFGEDWDGGTTFIYHDDGTTNGGYAEVVYNTTNGVKYSALEIYGLDADNNQVDIYLDGGGGDSYSISSTAFTTTDPSIITIEISMGVTYYTDPIYGTYDQDVICEYNQGVATTLTPVDIYGW